MRHLVVAALFAIGLLASASPAAAAARYCLQGGRNWGFPGNCQFATLRQCRAAASGTGATCGINPRYAFARQRHGSQQQQR